MGQTTKRGNRPEDPLREATNVALSRVIDPLLDLMFDAGVTVQELNQIIRERAVRNATKRVIQDTGRESRSRVAIATGIPRSEVSKILGSSDQLNTVHRGQHPARRVLAAWFEDRKFLTPDGEPAVLPIFGKRRSFELLVSLHSGGTPVRAMLDELTRIDALERLPNQRVRAKSRVPIFTGLNAAAIAMIGERGADLMDTLVKNVRRKTAPLFEATAMVSDADPEMAAVIHREINQQASSFISSINSLLNRRRVKPTRNQAIQRIGRRLGVTVYLFDGLESGGPESASGKSKRRVNLRRRAEEKAESLEQSDASTSSESKD